VDALVKAVKEWGALLEYAEIKDVEEMVKAGVQPILELETERGIVRVLSSDGAVLDVHGGFLNLGDCVVVAESTFAYTELVGGEESYEKPNVVGLATTISSTDARIAKAANTPTKSPRIITTIDTTRWRFNHLTPL
jgi:hypothetical protein